VSRLRDTQLPIGASAASRALAALGIERIYFCHVRRTGGTSLNQSFMGLLSGAPELLMATMRRSSSKVVYSGGGKIVGANRIELEAGNYLYGFSHIPVEDLVLPAGTFKVALIRDPIARVCSHYRMLRQAVEGQSSRPWIGVERHWLGDSIADFIDLVPENRLLAQLYMFSKDYNPQEAAESALSCDVILQNESLALGIEELGWKLSLPLRKRSANASTRESSPLEPSLLRKLRRRLDAEYEFIAKLEK
jgi:hypothetical protein